MLDQVKTEAARTNLAPIPMECDAPHLKVTGELPRELNGTLYRNGPNPQFDAPGAHWFLGDGMPACLPSAERPRQLPQPLGQHAQMAGQTRRRPRDIRRLRRQETAGRTGHLMHRPPRRRQHQHHLPWRKAFGAGGRPSADRDRARHAASPLAIATTRAPSRVRSRRIPRSIPRPARWCSSATTPRAPLTPALSFGSANAAGVVTRFYCFDAPYASMVHDFIVTENHMLFPILPITGTAWSAQCAASRLTPGSRRKAR